MPKQRSALWSNPQIKPSYGAVEVDWGHPLAHGLKAFFAMQEGAGRSLVALSSHQTATPDSNFTWGATTHGLALRNSATGALCPTTLPLTGTAFTWIVRFSLNVVDATFQSLATIAGPVDARFLLMDTVSGAGSFWGSDDGLGGNTLGVTGLVANRIYEIAWVRAGDNITGGTRAALDGVETGSANTATLTASADKIFIGSRSVLGQAILGALVFEKFYERALSAAEIQQAYAEPYAMLRPIIRRRYFVMGAPTGARTPQFLTLGVGS